MGKKTLWKASVLALGIAGCLSQGETRLGELENDIVMLEGRQRDLQGRLEALPHPSEDLKKTNAQMHIKIDALSDRVRALHGSQEEQRHALDQLSKQVDRLMMRSGSTSPSLLPTPSPPTASPPPSAPAPEDAVEESRSPTQPAAKPQNTEIVILPGRSVGEKIETAQRDSYDLAYNDYVRGNDDLALSGFSNYVQQNPTASRVPSALYWIGEIHYAHRKYPKAIAYYKQVYLKYPKNEKASVALLKEGLAYLEIRNLSEARVALKKVIERFPNSHEAALAKDKLASSFP